MKYTIRTVAGKTGLSVHTIRAWERRYGVLAPARTDTNRRLYDNSDVDRLTLLAAAIKQGHTIGQAAHLPIERLREVVEAESGHPVTPQAVRDQGSPEQIVAECEASVDRLDSTSLENALARSTITLGLWRTIEQVLVPLLDTIELRWTRGSLSIAQEHLASAVIQAWLQATRRTIVSPPNAPRILITTPQRQLHELGALIVAMMAAMYGWKVVYLGANVPADEIVQAIRQSRSNAVALSLVFPVDDPEIATELSVIRTELGPDFPILAGGRATGAYSTPLSAINAHVITSLDSLREFLPMLSASAKQRAS